MKKDVRFQLVAVNSKGKKVQILNEDNTTEFLDRIVDQRDGIVWVGSEPCDLKVVPV